MCSPYLIRPNNTSPNGYELGIGDPSPCSEKGDRDWYVEGRALAGKDLIGSRWTYSPYTGVGSVICRTAPPVSTASAPTIISTSLSA